MAGKARTVLELTAGPLAANDTRVTRVRGREALSETFAFEVEFALVPGVDPPELADLVGAETQLAIRRADGDERLVHGVAEWAELTGVRQKRPGYRLRLVPRLALLARGADCRIFQQLSVPEVVKQVLDEGEVAHRLSLSAAYGKREYCVQYREPDLDFAARLLEEEGIAWFFEHAEGSHTLVLADAPDAFRDLPGDPAVAFREPGQEAEDADDHVTAVGRVARLASEKVSLRDFDFARPALRLEASAGSARDPPLEVHGYRLAYADPAALKRLARVRLEEARVSGDELGGSSDCLRLQPGLTFELSDPPRPGLGGKLQLLRVEHEASWAEGADSARYACRFLAQPAGTPFRPARRAPRPAIAGAQTATVVGPAGEEIHTDEHGRIRVQLHWDRKGRRNERSSCFVRVAQPWAGPGWGASRIPRIGQEVLLRFLDGDPDRPVVLGALYNGASPPPLSLPGEKTRSTLRSDSSAGGGGYNELRFEDAQGAEELHLRAEKDENVAVEADKSQRVAGDESLAVTGNRSRTVNGKQRHAVARSDDAAVSGKQSLTVKGDRTTAVGAVQSESIGGTQSTSIAGVQDVRVGGAYSMAAGGAAALSVGGALAVTVGAAHNTAVGGALLEEVVGAREVMVAGALEETVRGDRSATVGGADEAQVKEALEETVNQDSTVEVAEGASLEAADLVTWLAKAFELGADAFTLQVAGKKALTMKKSGAVVIWADKVTFEASGALAFKGSKVGKEAGESTSGSASQKKSQAEKGSLTLSLAIPPAEAAMHADRFVLKSTDGSFKSEKTVKDDKVPGNDAIDLEFKDLPSDKKFTLEVKCGDTVIKLFEDVPFSEISTALSG
jgi:type VI secretion system secreted protein VgrG